jgi:hypothetical protein
MGKQDQDFSDGIRLGASLGAIIFLTAIATALLGPMSLGEKYDYQTHPYTDTIETDHGTIECGPRVGCRELKGGSGEVTN